MDETNEIEVLEKELAKLYSDKEYLEKELGTSDAISILSMVQSLENQLVEIYKEFENAVFIENDIIRINGPKKIDIVKS